MLDMRHSDMQCEEFQALLVRLKLTDKHQECSTTRSCPITTVSLHMRLCQTQCSECFYSGIGASHYRPCNCYDARNQRYSGTYLDRSLCRDCNKMSTADLLDFRKKRDRVTYKNL